MVGATNTASYQSLRGQSRDRDGGIIRQNPHPATLVAKGADVRHQSRRVLVLLAVAVLAQAGAAAAQCLTKPPKLAAALNGKDAYALARAEATRWNADSIFTKMVTTSEGRLDADGRASDWSIHFFSPAAGKLNMMSFTKGDMTCTPIDRSSGGRPIAV